MIDEMTNPALIAYVASDENATESEIELAGRLADAIDEINTLVNELTTLRAEHGADT